MPTEGPPVSGRREPLGDAGEVARLMGLPSWRTMSSLALIDQIEQGLPMATAERVARAMAPDDPRAKFKLLSRSTWTRLKKRSSQRPSREMSERVYGVARVVFEAGRLWSGDQAATVRFLHRPHLLLGGRTPLDVARESTVGADLVVRIIGEARAGVAV